MTVFEIVDTHESDFFMTNAHDTAQTIAET